MQPRRRKWKNEGLCAENIDYSALITINFVIFFDFKR